ncbi:hypothetical protein [Kocuria oceani]|uniref:Uncharacterized protein n=1 Tax=Kocuria oceani TaxID=988827 RepID=A0ABV9TMU0_9MICC|nr:hypothetical protein [Kocuria oceani]
MSSVVPGAGDPVPAHGRTAVLGHGPAWAAGRARRPARRRGPVLEPPAPASPGGALAGAGGVP